MMRQLQRALLQLAIVLALVQGCAVHSSPPPRAVLVSPRYYYGPGPFHYAGHVVYYDGWGYPIYYVYGVRYRVPVSYRAYGRMVRDYHRHRDEYRRHPREARRRRPPVTPPQQHPRERRDRHSERR